jgi:hypothetical protein
MSPLPLLQLLIELKRLAQTPPAGLFADAELRTKLYHASKKAALAIEQPTEVVTRLLLSHSVENTIVNIALKLEMFSKLGDTPQSHAALAASAGADSVLLSAPTHHPRRVRKEH